jgi:hypothetical protein
MYRSIRLTLLPLVMALDKLKLDVATIVGIHGDQASLEAARAAAKK